MYTFMSVKGVSLYIMGSGFWVNSVVVRNLSGTMTPDT